MIVHPVVVPGPGTLSWTVLTVAETQAILDACTRLRDRFFFALLYERGLPRGRGAGLAA